MKLIKCSYDGASTAPTFDMEFSQMSKDQMQSLLEYILDQAWPGEQHADVVYECLARAEENASLNNPYPRR
jgi:hypothetical protein